MKLLATTATSLSLLASARADANQAVASKEDSERVEWMEKVSDEQYHK